jgi:hypothetical protein
MDFVAVRSGRCNPWEVEPYSVWPLDFPHAAKNALIGGVCHDAKTGRIFVSVLFGDVVGYDPNPVIQVFRVALTGEPQP